MKNKNRDGKMFATQCIIKEDEFSYKFGIQEGQIIQTCVVEKKFGVLVPYKLKNLHG